MITEIQNTNDIQFIRAAWGNFKIEEISSIPQYNEIVYVWGSDTRDKLKELGYNTVLVSKDKYSMYYQSDETTFFHKLLALELACKTFNKVLMIDWDYILVKELDNAFFNYINTKEFLCSLYSYDTSEIFDYIKYPIDWPQYQSNNLQDYSWKLNDMYIIPNAAIVYTSNNSIGNTLLSIANKKQIKTLIEEFAIQIYSNCTLDEYIERHHPTFMYGRQYEKYDIINNYINTKLDMDIYFRMK